MGFCGEVEDCLWLVFGEQVGYQLVIVDIVGDEGVLGVVVEVGEVLLVVGVGEFVEVDYWFVMQGQLVEYEIGVDEVGVVGYENCYELYFV